MAILTRYLIRSHLGPFFFSFTLITGLLFLNTVAQRLDQLMGKGLPWQILARFAILALPSTVALTLPMSVLVAVLFAFSDLTAENEITAMTGGGVNPVRLLLPLLGIGVILAGGMFLFNDRVLPEANHGLKQLLVDVSHKTPTFQLREQVVNDIPTNVGDRRRVYYLQAVRIDPVTSTLEDIVIYDVTDPKARSRTTYAERGTMAFNETQTDLYLTLYDGEMWEIPSDEASELRRARFQEQFLPIRGVGNILQTGIAGSQRTDREMSTEMLADSARAFDEEREVFLDSLQAGSLTAVRRALGWRLVGDSLLPPRPGVPSSASIPQGARPRRLVPDEVTQTALLTARSDAIQAESLRLRSIKYRVEIHKKYAIAFACIVFVLVGAPLAVRFPRGGVGMVITASVAIFALFWVSLIGGETLADDGYLGPAVAMWLPNILLLPIGIILVSRISTQVATARGGGWDDLIFTTTNGIRKLLRRLAGKGPAEAV